MEILSCQKGKRSNKTSLHLLRFRLSTSLHYRNGKLPNHILKGCFWWRENLKNLPKFKGFVKIEVKNGSTTMLWQHKWQNQVWQDMLQELYSFAKNNSISVKSVLENEDVFQLFCLPISQIVFTQLQRVQQNLQIILLNENNDIWRFNWGSKLHSSRAYRELMGHSQVHGAYKWLWDCSCQPKQRCYVGS